MILTDKVSKLVTDCVITALDELEVTFDNEITDEADAVCTDVTVLDCEAHEETVAETEMLRDCNELIETAGLRDSTDAEEDEVILPEAIEERDNNDEIVDDIDEIDEILGRDDSDSNGVSVL